MANLYVLTEADRELMRRTIRAEVQRLLNQGGFDDVKVPIPFKEPYLVALAAGDSIQGFDGTNLHYQDCNLYKIVSELDDTDAVPQIVQDGKVRVFNTENADTPIGTDPPTFFLAVKDKFGRYIRNVGQPSDGTVPGKNVSGETMPAGGVVEIVDETVSGGVVTYHGTKPGTTFKKKYMVAAGDIADADTGKFYPPGQVAAFLCDTAPAIGDTYGPNPSSWTAKRGHPEVLRVSGVIDTTHAKGFVTIPLVLLIKNSTGSGIAGNSSGNFTILNDAEGSAGFSTVSMSNRGSTTFADTKIGSAVLINGKWYAMPWECP